MSAGVPSAPPVEDLGGIDGERAERGASGAGRPSSGPAIGTPGFVPFTGPVPRRFPGPCTFENDGADGLAGAVSRGGAAAGVAVFMLGGTAGGAAIGPEPERISAAAV